jgi:hypothetical protein
MRNALFVFALAVLASPAYAQEKKDEPKDITADVQKAVKDGKLMLGTTGKRFLDLSKHMSVSSASQTKNSVTIEIRVSKDDQNVRFSHLEGLLTAKFAPNKAKERALDAKGKEHFKLPGTLTLSIPDVRKLNLPVIEAPKNPKKGKGGNKDGAGKKNAGGKFDAPNKGNPGKTGAPGKKKGGKAQACRRQHHHFRFQA